MKVAIGCRVPNDRFLVQKFFYLSLRTKLWKKMIMSKMTRITKNMMRMNMIRTNMMMTMTTMMRTKIVMRMMTRTRKMMRMKRQWRHFAPPALPHCHSTDRLTTRWQVYASFWFSASRRRFSPQNSQLSTFRQKIFWTYSLHPHPSRRLHVLILFKNLDPWNFNISDWTPWDEDKRGLPYLQGNL